MEDAFIDYTSSGGAKGSVVDMKKWLKSTFQLFSASQHMLTNFIFDWGPEGPSHASHQSTSCHVRCSLYNPMTFAFVPLPSPFFYCGGSYILEMRRTSKHGPWRIQNLGQEMMYNTVTCTILLAIFVLSLAICVFVLPALEHYHQTQAA